MIRPSVSESLVRHLNTFDEPLESISAKFNADFDFNDKLTTLTGISLLLTDGLLSFPQQIVAIFILFNEYKSQPIKAHPFASVFQNSLLVQQSNPNAGPPQLREILASIVSGKGFGAAEKESVNAILSANFVFPEVKDPVVDRAAQFVPRISPVIATSNGDPALPASEQTQVLAKILQNDTFWSNFEPPFIRPIPDVSPIFEGELAPIQSFNSPDFLFDATSNSGAKAPILMMLTRAAENKLKQQQSQSLITEFKKDPSIFDESNFPQAKFACLIENNPDIAKEIVTTLGTRKPQIMKQLQCLDITVNSVDVVKHFVKFGNPPPDFLQGYAKNSIKLIQAIKESNTMIRKTRIFCMLMIVFIKDQQAFTEVLTADLNAFCTELDSKSIKETKELLSLL